MRHPSRRSRAGVRTREGISLVELLVALAILAMIVGVALPAYDAYGVRASRTQGQTSLLVCAHGLERAAAAGFGYAGLVDSDGDGAGDADTGAVSDNLCTPDGDDYRFAVVAADVAGFTLRAEPSGRGRMAGEGALEVDAEGGRRWDRNADGDFDDDGERRWQ